MYVSICFKACGSLPSASVLLGPSLGKGTPGGREYSPSLALGSLPGVTLEEKGPCFSLRQESEWAA